MHPNSVLENILEALRERMWLEEETTTKIGPKRSGGQILPFINGPVTPSPGSTGSIIIICLHMLYNYGNMYIQEVGKDGTSDGEFPHG